MKSRPILFSAVMVRALLDGTKTQTRRIYKDSMPESYGFTEIDESGYAWFSGPSAHQGLQCPYGQPGDQLWVREEHYQFGHWKPVEGKLTKGGRQKWKFVPDTDDVLFDAPFDDYRLGRHHKDPATSAWHKRLARFMPRKFSRITLEVVSIRVERLQEISEQDAIAEGVRCRCMSSAITVTPRVAYSELWESINGPGSWDDNPYVWVVEFRRVEA